MAASVNVLKAIDQYLITKAKNNDRDFLYFHPSSWDDCHRKTAYQYYEAKGLISVDDSAWKINPKLERVFDNGHYVHKRWNYYLDHVIPDALWGRWKCLNFSSHPEPKIYGADSKLGCTRPEKCECGSILFEYVEVGFLDEETMWGGHVDGIIDSTKWPVVLNKKEMKEDERFWVIDFKSMHHFLFGKLQSPKPDHITQMQIYLYLSGLKRGKLVYENKSDQSVKEYIVKRDDVMLAVKKEEALRLKQIVTHTNSKGKHVLPPRGYADAGHANCLRCKYRGHCWKNI